MSASKPSIEQLWQQAGGDGGRYRELMREHGYILGPGDEGYEEGSRTLPCGWPGSAQRTALGMLVRAVWVAWAREQPDAKPSWLASWADLDDGQREVDMRIGEAVADAERARLYAELGNEHYVTFSRDRFTVEHSVECKLSGHMPECAYHDAIRRVTDHYDPERLGRWRITGVSDGLPDLERADG